jgi:hypothetical protein
VAARLARWLRTSVAGTYFGAWQAFDAHAIFGANAIVGASARHWPCAPDSAHPRQRAAVGGDLGSNKRLYRPDGACSGSVCSELGHARNDQQSVDGDAVDPTRAPVDCTRVQRIRPPTSSSEAAAGHGARSDVSARSESFKGLDRGTSCSTVCHAIRA